MERKNYIYIIQEIYKNKNKGFSFFKNHKGVREYICEKMPTLVDEDELENETHTEYIVIGIAENKKEKITYDNIYRINNNGKIEWIEEYNEEGELYCQPNFVSDAKEEYKQKYNEFFYTEKDGKFFDYIDESETLEKLTDEYFKIQTL